MYTPPKTYGMINVWPVTAYPSTRSVNGHRPVIRRPDVETDIVLFTATTFPWNSERAKIRRYYVRVQAGIHCVCGVEMRTDQSPGVAEVGDEAGLITRSKANGGAKVAGLMFAYADHLEGHGVRADRVRALRERAGARALLAALEG